jgi:hypothetical protein
MHNVFRYLRAHDGVIEAVDRAQREASASGVNRGKHLVSS